MAGRLNRRCGAPLPTGGECMRRELHANHRCPWHGGEGPLLRIERKAQKDTRRRSALVAEAERFARQLRAAGHLPPKAGE